MIADVALIGGTGVGDILAKMEGSSIHVPTPAGQLAGRLIDDASGPILVVSRHSAGHKAPPHRVNYKAIALGLKKAGVKFCFSTAAVGSLRPDWRAGTLVEASDFLDNSGRGLTLYDDRVVHTDFSSPFSRRCRESLRKGAAELGLQLKTEGVYICENGPRYETPREIELLATSGDVVGMTAASEAVLLKEAGIQYACLAVVTNAAAGLTKEPLSHLEVVDEMIGHSAAIVELLLRAVRALRKAE